jgi:hypothetical protein
MKQHHRHRKFAEKSLRERQWNQYINPVMGLDIEVDSELFDKINDRTDVMDGMAALAGIWKTLPRPVENPAQMEYHLQSIAEHNPLEGITVHFLTLDGKGYVSEREFFPYE